MAKMTNKETNYRNGCITHQQKNFTPDIPSDDDFITARLNEIYNELDSSLEPCYMMAQIEVLGNGEW